MADTQQQATRPDRPMAIAADVGGTNLRVGLVDCDGTIERLAVMPTPTGDVDIIDALAHQIDAMTSTAQGAAEVIGIGIGLPGRLGDDGERWSLALNLGVSSTVALRSRLEPVLHKPLLIGNDVRLSTLGAARHFSDVERLAYLSVGTGVAGGGLGRSADGEIAVHSGFVGEIGHITVPDLDTDCVCGQTGCVESAAGGGAMLRRWHDLGGADIDDVSALWDRADHGDVDACSIRDDCVAAIAWSVRLYSMAIGADAVVIGGGVSRLGSRLFDRVTARLDDDAQVSPLMESFGLARRLRMAPATSEFGLVGAAHLVFASGASS